ncbi:response regulator [Legionella lytica]|uniref:Response regulator n=1 Tax=Legionella lytica TaxID=96232 RepID=A0ABY4YB84_9GAMM|nr:response regulator [Legionella lytica]USQ14791.1 response regulator [Legionella lytica]
MKIILLVEDDPSIQDAMQLVFQEPEYKLLLCSKAEEVLAENMPVPDVYLIDKQLSGFDGIELCRILKMNERTKAVPVIILSASPNIKELALELGANDVLEKPFKIQSLKEKICWI